MHLSFSPVRSDATLVVVRKGDTLTINGDVLDFGPLPEGGLLPAEAVANPWVVGPVERQEGRLSVELALPHGPDASQARRFPAPITQDHDGPVVLPV